MCVCGSVYTGPSSVHVYENSTVGTAIALLTATNVNLRDTLGYVFLCTDCAFVSVRSDLARIFEEMSVCASACVGCCLRSWLCSREWHLFRVCVWLRHVILHAGYLCACAAFSACRWTIVSGNINTAYQNRVSGWPTPACVIDYDTGALTVASVRTCASLLGVCIVWVNKFVASCVYTRVAATVSGLRLGPERLHAGDQHHRHRAPRRSHLYSANRCDTLCGS